MALQAAAVFFFDGKMEAPPAALALAKFDFFLSVASHLQGCARQLLRVAAHTNFCFFFGIYLEPHPPLAIKERNP